MQKNTHTTNEGADVLVFPNAGKGRVHLTKTALKDLGITQKGTLYARGNVALYGSWVLLDDVEFKIGGEWVRRESTIDMVLPIHVVAEIEMTESLPEADTDA